MNFLKKLACFTLAATVMVLSFCGCHKKGEIALKIGDTDFTTGMYIAALYEEGLIALSKIDTTDLDTSKEGYYRSQKIDGKVFGDYATDNTLDSLKKIVALEKYMKKYDIKLTDEEEKSIKENYTMLWNKKFLYNEEENYSLGKYLENNGVSKDTYLKIMRGIQIEENAFDKMYGKEGKKAIADEEIKKYFIENYVVYNSVASSNYSEKTDDEKAEIKAKYQDLESKINAGSVSFEDAYKELVALNSTGEGTETSAENQTPQDYYANKDDEDTYKTVSEIANNSAKLVVSDDNSTITLYYKKDINADENGITTYDETIRHSMKDEEFNNELKAIMKDLKVTNYKSALSAVKIDKIDFHAYMEVYQTALNELTGTMSY